MENKIKAQVCVLANCLNAIGGIETFVYNWCDLMKDTYDIVVAVTRIDEEQNKRLKKIVKVVKSTENIECDTLIVMHIGTKTIPDNIKYKKKVQMVHGCKNAGLGYGAIPNCDVVVPVSETAKESFGAELNNLNVNVIYNPINDYESKRVLKLISATRLTHEKGYERMVKLARMLKYNNIPYVWYVFTNDKKIDSDLFVKMSPAINIKDYIAGCDYLVQLSDTESFCYSIVEALELSVPIIATNLPVLKELNIKNNEHGFIIPFNMSDIDVVEIYNRVGTFFIDYKINNTEIINQWMGIIGKPKEFIKYKYEGDKIMRIEITKKFQDTQEIDINGKKKMRNVGDIIDVKKERADFIVNSGYAVYVKEEKEEKPVVEEEEIKVPFDDIVEEEKPIVEEKKPAKKRTTKAKKDNK